NDFPRLFPHRENIQTFGSYLYANIVENEDGTADWRFSKEAIFLALKQGRAKDRWDEYEALSMPILVVRGSTSTDLSQKVYEEMLARNVHAQGIVISPSGHWVHSDQPLKFIEALKSFLVDSKS
ncbi:MAG: alpha/beta fold hydrolase, partial [Pseudobdellovibrionaceae bacterium]